MSKIIVLEGPDFAGKSTLAEKIKASYEKRHFITDVWHTGQPELVIGETLFDQYVRRISEASRNREAAFIVFDRLHVGEAIYGPIYRSDSMLSNTQLRAIDELLDDLGATKVFVDTQDVDLVARFRGTRGDDLVDKEETLLRIARDYRNRLAPATDVVHGSLLGWIRWTPRHTVAAGI